jgi:hypothetical protein
MPALQQPDPEIVRKVHETRAAQGLPPTVQDPGTLERVAAVLRLVKVEQEEEKCAAKRTAILTSHEREKIARLFKNDPK